MTSEEQINEIMDNFDFRKVHDAMVYLQWTWNGGIPTEPEIRKEARRLLQRVGPSCEICATGGFRAEYLPPHLTDGACGYRLSFEIESWDTE